MATAFDTTFAAAAVVLFQQFGEPVQYISREGTRRDITAIVVRDQIQPLDPVDGALAPMTMVKVFSDPYTATYGGIDPADDFGGAKLRFPRRKGGTPEDRPIAKFHHAVGGLTFLEVN